MKPLFSSHFFSVPARPTVVLTVFHGGKLGGCFFSLSRLVHVATLDVPALTRLVRPRKLDVLTKILKKLLITLDKEI